MAGTVSLHRRLKELERQREREALQRIERLLPAAFTSSAQQNSAGKRSVGAFGRSQINILSDLVRYVSSVKHRGVVSDASPILVPPLGSLLPESYAEALPAVATATSPGPATRFTTAPPRPQFPGGCACEGRGTEDHDLLTTMVSAIVAAVGADGDKSK